MKIALIATFAVSAIASVSTAHAQVPCRVYEYAELKEMQRERMLDLFCAFKRTDALLMDSMRKSNSLTAKADKLRESGQCMGEIIRTLNLYEQRFGPVQRVECPPDAGGKIVVTPK